MEPDRLSRRKRARQIVAARLERLEDLSIGQLIPSSITLLALCCGVTAIRFGLHEQWPVAVAFVITAMILDMLDGRAARMLGADSRFGAQLDSLADQATLLPSTLPFSSGPEPCAACWVPVRAAPSVAMSKVAFWAPRGELITISHLPSRAMLFS